MWLPVKVLATPAALADSLLSEQLMVVCLECIGASSADNPPALLSLAITAAGAGGTASVILRRTQRAWLQATLEYLWCSPNHGGLRGAEGFEVLPTALPRHLPDIEENNLPAPLPSLPPTLSYSDTPSKRGRLDEGSSLSAFSTGSPSKAWTRSSPPGAPLTKVTLSKQVSVKFISRIQNTE